MSLSRGDRAPSFSLYGAEREAVHLDDYLGERVLLIFYPGAFIPVYTELLTGLNDALDEFEEEGVAVLAISTDSPFVLAEYREMNMIDYPLLSDHDAIVSAEYGVKHSHDFTDMMLDRIARCAAFLLDEEGVVSHVQVMRETGETPDSSRLLDQVSEAR